MSFTTSIDTESRRFVIAVIEPQWQTQNGQRIKKYMEREETMNKKRNKKITAQFDAKT